MRYIVLALALVLSACTPTVLDTTTEETTKASLAKLADEANFDQRTLLAQAVTASALEAGFQGKGSLMSAALASYNGMSLEQIIQAHKAEIASKEIERAAKKAAERKAISDKLSESEAAQSVREKSLSSLAQVKVENLRFETTKRSFMDNTDLKTDITNGQPLTLTAITVKYRIITPGREVPWNEGEARFLIDGGLEQGESRAETAYDLHNFILSTKAIKEHPEAVLEWNVVDAYGVDKKSIIAPDMTDEIQRLQARLKSLDQ